MFTLKHEYLIIVLISSILILSLANKEVQDNKNKISQLEETINQLKNDMSKLESLKTGIQPDTDTNRPLITPNKVIVSQNATQNKKVDNITLTLDTGEIIQYRNNTNKTINKDEMIYKTVSNGSEIIFMGERYENMLPDSVVRLLLIILDMKNIPLKINETFNLKDNYSIVFYKIDNINQNYKAKILKDNKVIRDITTNNPNIEYWKELDDDKKQKLIIIKPIKISDSEIISDIVQYGDKKAIILDSKFAEFRVTNITNNTIIMKNYQPIKLDNASIMNGKIKI